MVSIIAVELLSALCALYYTGKQKRSNTSKLMNFLPIRRVIAILKSKGWGLNTT